MSMPYDAIARLLMMQERAQPAAMNNPIGAQAVAPQQAPRTIGPIPQGPSKFQQQLAQQMMAQGADTSPVQHWTQGLARLVQAGIGGYQAGKHNEADAARQKAIAEAVGGLQAGDQGQVANLAASGEDGMQAAIFAKSMQPEPKKPAEPPKTRTYTKGDQEITEQFDPATNAWSQVSTAPRWNPSQQPLVEVQTGGKEQDEEGKAVGKYYGEMYGKLQDQAMAAQKDIANINRVNQLLDEVNTGKFKGTTQQLKKAALSVGIDLSAMGVKDDTAPIDAASGIVNQMALALRNPESGLGMPGALSERDLQFLRESTLGVEQTPDGRKLMSESMVALAKRRMDVARLARRYRRDHGRIDEGFQDEVEKFAEENPLFKDTPKSKPAQATNALDELRKRAQAGDADAKAYLRAKGLL